MSSLRMLSSRSVSRNRRGSTAPSILTSTNHRSDNDSPPPPPFSQTTPIHGIKRTGQGSASVRAFYAMLVILAVTATAICFTYTVIEVAANPTYVITRTDAKASLQIPRISFCNLNPLRLSSLPDFEDYLDTRDDNAGQIEAVYFGSGKECALCVDGKIDAELFRDEYTQLHTDRKLSYGHQLDDMLLSCKYFGQACSIDDFTPFVDDFYGNCYTFDPEDSNSLFLNRSGPEMGLILELNLETEEYVSSVSETAGARILIESRDTTTYCSRKQNDVAISPGKDTYLGMKSSISTSSCSRQTLSYSSGAWPTSLLYSDALVSMATGDESGMTQTSTISSQDLTTTLIPTLEELEGSATDPTELPSLIEAYPSLPPSRKKRDVSEQIWEQGLGFKEIVITDENVRRDSSIGSEISNFKDDSEQGAGIKPGETYSYYDRHKNGVFTSKGEKNDAETIQLSNHEEMKFLNQNIKYQNLEAMGETLENFQETDGSDGIDGDTRTDRRVRREAVSNDDEIVNDNGNSSSSSSSSNSSTTENSVDVARKRFCKLRVFYENMDEDVEKTRPVYPWFVIVSLIGGQLAVFCGLSGIAVLEAVEYGYRKLMGYFRRPERNNRVGPQPAW